MSDKNYNEELFILSNMVDNEPEFIPLISEQEEDDLNKEDVPETLPILALRNNVLFPGVVIPITIGRAKSVKLIEDAYNTTKFIGVVSQTKSSIENPTPEDLNKIGTVAHIIKRLKMPDGSTTIIIQGKRRFEISKYINEDPYFIAEIKGLMETRIDTKIEQNQALVATMKDLAHRIIKESPNLPSEAGFAIKNIESATFLVNFIASNLNSEITARQEILEISDIAKRIERVIGELSKELQMLAKFQ